jgi:hypothetical protein
MRKHKWLKINSEFIQKLEILTFIMIKLHKHELKYIYEQK